MPAGAAGAAGAGGASSRASSAGATAAAVAAPVTLCGVAGEMISLVIVGPRDVAKHDYVHRSALTDLLGSLIAGRFDQKSLRGAVNLAGGAIWPRNRSTANLVLQRAALRSQAKGVSTLCAPRRAATLSVQPLLAK